MILKWHRITDIYKTIYPYIWEYTYKLFNGSLDEEYCKESSIWLFDKLKKIILSFVNTYKQDEVYYAFDKMFRKFSDEVFVVNDILDSDPIGHEYKFLLKFAKENDYKIFKYVMRILYYLIDIKKQVNKPVSIDNIGRDLLCDRCSDYKEFIPIIHDVIEVLRQDMVIVEVDGKISIAKKGFYLVASIEEVIEDFIYYDILPLIKQYSKYIRFVDTK